MVAMTRKKDIEALGKKTGRKGESLPNLPPPTTAPRSDGLYSDNPDMEADKLVNNKRMLHPKMFRKNMVNAWDLITSYGNESGVGIDKIDFYDNSAIMQTAYADVGRGNQLVYNQARYLRDNPIGKGEAGKVQERAGKENGKYRAHAADRNYTSTHETGHIVNRALLDKLRGSYGSLSHDKLVQWSNDWNRGTTAGNVVVDSIRDVYDRDETFRNKFNEKAGVVEGDDDVTRMAKVNARLGRTDQNAGRLGRYNSDADIKREADKKVNELKAQGKHTGMSDDALRLEALKTMGVGAQDDIYSDMHDMGYTSEYGASNPIEFFAEAHADKIKLGKKNKVNPLSSAIVNKTQGLLAGGPDGDTARNVFKTRHGIT